jgi:peptidyl-tRNA hydrolase
MKVKILYRRNLKMSPQKLAAQTCHAVIGLGVTDCNLSVIVLMMSDNKYFENAEKLQDTRHYRVIDAGYTEVPPNTETCLAYYEE